MFTKLDDHKNIYNTFFFRKFQLLQFLFVFNFQQCACIDNLSINKIEMKKSCSYMNYGEVN